jgi:hypothetical protein
MVKVSTYIDEMISADSLNHFTPSWVDARVGRMFSQH